MKYRVKGNNEKKDFLAEIFRNRDIPINNIQNFLKTKDADVQSPKFLDNIVEGVKLLHYHIERKSKILIIPDCDVDGLTSAAIVWNFIREVYSNCNLNFIMHESKQHGISNDLYNDVEGYDLIIMPDASSNDYFKHEELKALGVDILVLDHHDAKEYSSFAVVINNQLSEYYRNKSLSGAGVVWQFIKFYKDYFYLEDIDIDKYLDLVALGNVADIMDLRSIETKHLVTKGLKNINNPLFKSACAFQEFSMKGKATPSSIAWYIGPLLNAMVRVGEEEEKNILFKSMLSDYKDTNVPSTKRGHSDGETESIQEQAIRLCSNARNRQNKLVDEGMAFINKKIEEENLTKNKLLLIEIPQDKIKAVLVGLVANKIASQYQQPTLILRDLGDKISGSGRNFGNSPIEYFKEELQSSNLVDLAEGHSSAFGCIISKDNKEKVINYFNEKWKDIKFEIVYLVDFDFNLANRGEEPLLKNCALSIGSLNKEGLWGKGIEEPFISIRNIPLYNIKLMSPDKKPTLKITIGNDITIIKFKSSQEEFEKIKPKGFYTNKFNIIGKCNLNEWAGKVSPQILVEDFQLIETNTFDF